MTLTRNLPAVRRPAAPALRELEDYRRSVVGTQSEILARCRSHPFKLEPVSLRQLGPDRGEDTRYEAIVVKVPPRTMPRWGKVCLVSLSVSVPLSIVCFTVIWVVAHLTIIAAVAVGVGLLALLSGGGIKVASVVINQ